MMNFTVSWIVLVFVLLWVGYYFLTKLLNRHLSWLKFGNIRFFTHLICGILYSLLVINLTYTSLKFLLTMDPPTTEQLVVMNVYGAVIFIPIFSIYFSLQFLRSWRKSEVESEKFQKESIRSQLESLRSHLDPHFLFNNLNILSALIDRDPVQSKVFLYKFAEVYRLLLRSKSEDLIPLSEELRFVESYCFLIETRFGQSIRISISIPEKLHSYFLPPLTLQMLVENAIKHNVVTEKKPLTISVSGENQVLTVSNSLNEKKEPAGKKPGSGLENIKMRYRHYTKESLRIAKTESEFTVTIPLLQLTTL